MADRILFISWGQVVRGREEHSLEVFNEAMGFYGRCQQDGRIERFDVSLLTPSGGIDGYIALYGTADQMAALKADEEFMRHTVDAGLVVDDLRVIDGWTGEGIAQQMAIYTDAASKVPQHT